MPFPLGEPFSVENSSADLLHFPPWRALGRVEGFVGGRELENATDPHRLRLETILHIPGLTSDRHWAGQRRQGYIFSHANNALFFGFSSTAAAPPLLQRFRQPKPVTTQEDLPRFRSRLGIWVAIPDIKLLACTEVTRSPAESVRSFWIRKDVGGSLCDPILTCMVLQSSCC